jgi:hypothetical protein
MKTIQRYISKELTHFVGRHLRTEEDQYELLRLILETGELRPNAVHVWANGYALGVHGHEKLSSNKAYEAAVVCFCDIPVEDFEIHMCKYSRCGLAFSKAFLVEKDVNPVFYIAQNAVPRFSTMGEQHLLPGATRDQVFDAFYEEYSAAMGELMNLRNAERIRECGSMPPGPLLRLLDRIEQLKHFWDDLIFSHMLFFDTRKPEDSKENLYMEREWRARGSVRFTLNDVSRIIIPKNYGERFRGDFPKYFGQVTFSL